VHVPGDLLDLIVLILAAVFAGTGYRQGLIMAVANLIGFIGGALAGALVAGPISRALVSAEPWQAFTAILVIFIAAIIGMLLISALGGAVRSRVRARRLAVLDSVGGAAVNVIAVVLVAWLIGVAVVRAPLPGMAAEVSHSLVLRRVDAMLPPAALDFPAFAPLSLMVGDGAAVFEALGADSAESVPTPNRAVLSSPGAEDSPSVVHVEGFAPDCAGSGVMSEGSGFVISPGYVLTNAHVVAGVTQDLTVTTVSGKRYRAEVMRYDITDDVAVLRVPRLTAPPLVFASQPAPRGTDVIMAGYPGRSGKFTLVPARIALRETAASRNIYGAGPWRPRKVYVVRTTVQKGNSGGPLIGQDGQVYGMVFGRSPNYADEGYALTAGDVTADVLVGENASAPVRPGHCLPS
jgi:S1-C subfamily serine protease